MPTDMYKNKFVRNVLDRNAEFLKNDPIPKENFNRFLKGKPIKKKKYPPYMEYNVSVFHSLTSIINTLDDLKMVLIFLRQYPYSKTLKKHKITRASYVIYHLEYYFIKVVSLRDKLALLINTVFEFGLPEKTVNLELISRMKQLKKNPIALLIKRFIKALEGISHQRNIIIHRRKYDDNDISNITLYELIAGNNMKLSLLIKLMTRDYIRKRIQTFKQNQEAIELFLDTIFLSLNKEFNRRCNILIIKDKPIQKNSL